MNFPSEKAFQAPGGARDAMLQNLSNLADRIAPHKREAEGLA
jgi:hypothetical protein